MLNIKKRRNRECLGLCNRKDSVGYNMTYTSRFKGCLRVDQVRKVEMGVWGKCKSGRNVPGRLTLSLVISKTVLPLFVLFLNQIDSVGISKQQRKAGTKYSFYLKWLTGLPFPRFFFHSLDECPPAWAPPGSIGNWGGQMIGACQSPGAPS